VTRSHSFTEGIDDRETIYRTACDLLRLTEPETRKIRLLGISVSNFANSPDSGKNESPDQLQLF
jgi:DNA polymerase-4